MADRPWWPPGQEITAQAFEAYGEWERKWSEDLEDVCVISRPIVYSYMLEGIDIDTAKMMAARDQR